LDGITGFLELTGIWLSGTFLPKGVRHPGAESTRDTIPSICSALLGTSELKTSIVIPPKAVK